jgi:hypothetical protein
MARQVYFLFDARGRGLGWDPSRDGRRREYANSVAWLRLHRIGVVTGNTVGISVGSESLMGMLVEGKEGTLTAMCRVPGEEQDARLKLEFGFLGRGLREGFRCHRPRFITHTHVSACRKRQDLPLSSPSQYNILAIGVTTGRIGISKEQIQSSPPPPPPMAGSIWPPLHLLDVEEGVQKGVFSFVHWSYVSTQFIIFSIQPMLR